MQQTIRFASLLGVLAFLVSTTPLARAADEVEVPNINKRGDDEKKFVEKMAVAIVTGARTGIKANSVTVRKYEKKEPKAGRTEFQIEAGYKGSVTGTSFTAKITVHVDTADKDKWEVTRIEYSDNNKSLIGWNRKNVLNLVDKLNGKTPK